MKKAIVLWGVLAMLAPSVYAENTEKEEIIKIEVQVEEENTMPESEKMTKSEIAAQSTAAIANLGASILKTVDDNENLSISPLSIAYALGMTANGAAADTRTQMETVMGTDVETLNEFLQDYGATLQETLSIANSIWFNDAEHVHIEDSFLKTSETIYSAGVYQLPFLKSTYLLVNDWIAEHTMGLIENMIKKPFEPDTVMCLVNALAFEGKWREPYSEYSIAEDTFTTSAGEVQNVEFMSSSENFYIKLDNAIGFKKYYEDFKYSFVALLPNESLDGFIASMDMPAVLEAVKNPVRTSVNTKMPKFAFDYDVELRDILMSLGMPLAFDRDYADFSLMGTSDVGKLYIGDVLHNTTIDVDENGTVASAATVVMIMNAMSMPVEIKEVYLDRPFFFMIMDEQTNLPLFMGAVNNIK